MNRFDPSRFAVPGLALLSLVLALVVGWTLYQRNQKHNLTIAAGARSGESFALAQALKTVAERHHPRLKITVRETAGTAENLDLLERKAAQLAAAQADVPAGPSARLVALLYVDVFQLLVQNDSRIRWFPDLAGKRIALPRKGGQYQSFLKVAEHFGLSASDFHFLDDDLSTEAFALGEADAIFRVRALGNPAIRELAHNGRIRLIGVQQAAAMKIMIPSLDPAVIPEGAYRGNPPIPDRAIRQLLGVQRMLVAHTDLGASSSAGLPACCLSGAKSWLTPFRTDSQRFERFWRLSVSPTCKPGLARRSIPALRNFSTRTNPPSCRNTPTM